MVSRLAICSASFAYSSLLTRVGEILSMMVCGSAASRNRRADSNDFWNPAQSRAGMLSTPLQKYSLVLLGLSFEA
jgi:hypothetical protein